MKTRRLIVLVLAAAFVVHVATDHCLWQFRSKPEIGIIASATVTVAGRAYFSVAFHRQFGHPSIGASVGLIER